MDARQVAAAIAAVPAGAHVAVDADGTLWDADVGDDTVRCAAQAWAPGTDVDAYLETLEADYGRGARLAAEHLRGVAPDVARAALRSFFAPRLRPRRWLVEALSAAQARGVPVVVVSASPRIAAEVGVALIGVQWPVIGIELDAAGAVVEPAPVIEGKVAAWRARGLPPPALALGDSQWDGPLLRSAAVSFRLVHAGADPHRDTPLADLA
jgi:phosphoserine phosphatase